MLSSKEFFLYHPQTDGVVGLSVELFDIILFVIIILGTGVIVGLSVGVLEGSLGS
jgi:hypothetical protein